MEKRIPIIFSGNFPGNIFGDGSLHSGCGKSKGEGKNGRGELVDTHSLSPKGA